MGVTFCEAWGPLTSYKITTDGHIHWTGFEGFIRNHYYSIYDFNTHNNDSIVRANSHGVKISDDAYDGCIGMMQANKSDFTSTTMDVPISQTNLTQMQVMFRINFFLIYLDQQKTRQKDNILYNPFTLDTSITVLVLSLLICIVYASHFALLHPLVNFRRRKKWPRKLFSRGLLNSLFFFKFYLRQYSLRWAKMESSLCFVIFTCLSSIISLIYVSSISTGLQVTVKNDFIKTYDQVVKKNLTVFVLSAGADQMHLQKASPGSLQRQIYDHNLHRGIFGYTGLQSNWFLEKMSNKNSIFFISYPPTFLRAFCSVRLKVNMTQFVPVIFVQEDHTTKAFAVRNGFKGDKLTRRIKRTFESDLINAFYDRLWPYEFRRKFVKDKRSFDSCTNSQISSINYASFRPISLSALKITQAILTFVFFISFYLFRIECYLHQSTRANEK